MEVDIAMRSFTIALVQSDLKWEDPVANRQMFREKVLSVRERIDMFLFPEMFTTGFSMEPERLYEEKEGPTSRFLRELAREAGAAIGGSYIVREEGHFFNRFLWVNPEGEEHTYDKRHLFQMGGEDRHYTPGKKRVTFQWRGVRIRPFICYDLRFPVWIRTRNDADLLLFVANWPAARSSVWTTLLKARALENQVYVAGVNRTGTDGRDISYNGHSLILSPRGGTLASLPPGEEGILVATLDLDELEEFRKKFPVHLDADDFELKL